MTTPFLKTSITCIAAMLAMASFAQTAAPAPAPAHAPYRMDPAQMEKMLERRVDHMVKSVNASPEQKEKLMVIAKAAQADIKPLHDQVRARMDKAIADSKEVLTPEQRTKWEEKMKSFRGRMQERMHEHSRERMSDRPDKK